MQTSTFEPTEAALTSAPATINTPESALRRGAARAQDGLDALMVVIGAIAPALLRVSLGLVYLWFGGLKIVGHSPVEALLGATLPWFDPAVTVPALGAVEVILGLALLSGRAQRLVLLACAGHLAGTFLTFVTAPYLMVQHSTPTLLTSDGEFVLKNLVLISAALLLASGRTTHLPATSLAPGSQTS